MTQHAASAPATGETRFDETDATWKTTLRGRAVLTESRLNKGTAFSREERRALGLVGLLPPRELTLEQERAVVADKRLLMAQAAYQWRDRQPRIMAWNPRGEHGDHYQLQHSMPNTVGQDVLVLTTEYAPSSVLDVAVLLDPEGNAVDLHADLLLRQVSRQSGSGSIADGQVALHTLMTQAGVPEGGYYFADGSGMSSYNRITPRAAVTLLGWIAKQPWGAAWRDTLPIAGEDGTLRNRFKGTLLQGKLFAKTGSLNAARALSGYFVTRSGRTLIFSALANDMPDGTDGQASAAVDRALVALAEAL